MWTWKNFSIALEPYHLIGKFNYHSSLTPFTTGKYQDVHHSSSLFISPSQACRGLETTRQSGSDGMVRNPHRQADPKTSSHHWKIWWTDPCLLVKSPFRPSVAHEKNNYLDQNAMGCSMVFPWLSMGFPCVFHGFSYVFPASNGRSCAMTRSGWHKTAAPVVAFEELPPRLWLFSSRCGFSQWIG